MPTMPKPIAVLRNQGNVSFVKYLKIMDRNMTNTDDVSAYASPETIPEMISVNSICRQHELCGVILLGIMLVCVKSGYLYWKAYL